MIGVEVGVAMILVGMVAGALYIAISALRKSRAARVVAYAHLRVLLSEITKKPYSDISEHEVSQLLANIRPRVDAEILDIRKNHLADV